MKKALVAFGSAFVGWFLILVALDHWPAARNLVALVTVAAAAVLLSVAVIAGFLKGRLAVAALVLMLAPDLARAQDLVALPPPGQVPPLPAGLPSWVTTLITIIFTLGPVVAALYRLVAPLLNSLKRKSDAAYTMLVVEELAASVVTKVEVEIRPQRVAAGADGVVTAEEAAALQAEALRLFDLAAPVRLRDGLHAMFGSDESVKLYVTGLLERANAASKVDAHPTPIPPPAPTA